MKSSMAPGAAPWPSSARNQRWTLPTTLSGGQSRASGHVCGGCPGRTPWRRGLRLLPPTARTWHPVPGGARESANTVRCRPGRFRRGCIALARHVPMVREAQKVEGFRSLSARPLLSPIPREPRRPLFVEFRAALEHRLLGPHAAIIARGRRVRPWGNCRYPGPAARGRSRCRPCRRRRRKRSTSRTGRSCRRSCR